MPTNKNAQLRYQILDSCFSDFHRKYFIEVLMDKVNDALMNLYGTIRLTVRPNKELEARIFSYGNQVEVLKPECLRRQITEKLQEILKKYSSVQEDCNITSKLCTAHER